MHSTSLHVCPVIIADPPRYLSLLQGSTFLVAANESITVRSITVRGTTITSAKEQLGKPCTIAILLILLYSSIPYHTDKHTYYGDMVLEFTDQREFNLSISIKPQCGESPLLCPCPSDSGCPKQGN